MYVYIYIYIYLYTYLYTYIYRICILYIYIYIYIYIFGRGRCGCGLSKIVALGSSSRRDIKPLLRETLSGPGGVGDSQVLTEDEPNGGVAAVNLIIIK